MSQAEEPSRSEQFYWREVELHGRHNVRAHLLQGGLGIFGMSFFAPETALAAYMTTMTSSKFLIGLPAAITGFAWSFTMLFYCYVIQRKKQRKQVALRVGSLVRFAFVAIAASAWAASFWGFGPAMSVFFAALVLLSFTAGGSAMAWQDFIGRTLPHARRGFFFGLREATAGLAGFGGALLLSLYLRGRGKAPGDYAWPFTTGALFYFASWYLLSRVREPVWPGDPVPEGTWRQYYRETFRILRDNLNFRTYVLVRCLLAVTAIFNFALFASYAIKEFGIAEALVAGVFGAVSLLGRAVAGPVAGRIADRTGFKLPLVAGVAIMVATLAIGLALKPMGSYALVGFLCIYFLAGVVGTVIWVANFNLQLEFSAVSDRPRYIALASTISAPVYLVASAASGYLVDRFHYRPVMFAALLVALAVLALVSLLFEEPRKARPQSV